MLNFWCGFVGIFILSCGIAVLQNQVICGIQKFSGNFNVVFLCYTVQCLYIILRGFEVFVPSLCPLLHSSTSLQRPPWGPKKVAVVERF